MRFMGINRIKEKVEIDMVSLDLKGDIIDVGVKNYGIIYKICKEQEDEVALEYVTGEGRTDIERGYYDTAVLFFALSPLSNSLSRKRMLKEIFQYLRGSGEIHLWDINKSSRSLVDLEVKVLLPKGEEKCIRVKNYNPISSINLDQVKQLIKPYFEVTDEKSGDSIFYLRAKRKGKDKDESIVDCT